MKALNEQQQKELADTVALAVREVTNTEAFNALADTSVKDIVLTIARQAGEIRYYYATPEMLLN